MPNSLPSLQPKKFWSRRSLCWKGGSYEERPSFSCWAVHSAGKSRKLASPMPRGRRPRTAASTRVGARKASVIARLTCRMLHFSRSAICLTSPTVPAISSSSHRRPFAIPVTSLARVSARVGRCVDTRARLPVECKTRLECPGCSYRGSKPLAVKASLTAEDFKYAISALAPSICLLSALIPATYKE